MTETGKHYNILNHELVPEHIILSDKEKDKLLKDLDIQPDQLPKILNNDPAAIVVGAQPGQIIKILRKSRTAKVATTYRLVIESEADSKARIGVRISKAKAAKKDTGESSNDSADKKSE